MLIRCHCLAHARRQFSELTDDFPAESAVVVEALKLVYEHDKQAHEQQLNAQRRLVYHQTYSEPIFTTLKTWLERQTTERFVSPIVVWAKRLPICWTIGTRSRGWCKSRALRWTTNNVAEHAVKLAIRQRKNSLFYATEHSAYIASILTGVNATCVQAGVNALEYLVALQAHRQEVFANPSAFGRRSPRALVTDGSPSGASWARSGWPLPKSTFNSHAESVTLGVVAVGHQEKRPWDNRFVHP